MKLKFLVTLAFIIASPLSGKVLAQTNQEIIDRQIIEQDWITRQQQSQIEEQRRVQEKEAILKERKRRKKQQKAQKDSKIPGRSAKCFPLKSVTLIDANSITKKQQTLLIKPFIGKCVSAQIINQIITQIQTYYNNNGYVTARIAVPKQNIQSGRLKLKAHEGITGDIYLNNDQATDKMQEVTAFGFLEGKILNINDINQGLYQINRLPSNKATMKIEPGQVEGEAIVAIANQGKFPARASISYDNLGNEFTGIRKSTFSGNFDNLLFLNDAINLSYTTNLNDSSSNKELKSFSTGISIPLAYNTISYDYSRTEFRGTNQGQNSITRLTGYSNRNNITFDRLLLNDGNLRISGNASLAAKDSASYLNKQKIETSQRKLTIGKIGLNISNYFKNGINIYANPSYSRGLKLLDAKKDDAGLGANNPRAQFDLLKFYGNISKKVKLPQINAPIILTSEANAQISKHTLFGSEQFSVGGYYSVRGFRENYITGDSGYHLRNKARFNLGQMIISKYHLNKFNIETFYDYGRVKNRNNQASGRLSGAGIKTLFNSKYFTASLTYSWAVNKSSLITSPKKENKMLFFELKAKCC